MDEPNLDISSLIDVCFLLLIFFIVTQTIQPQEQDLPLQLPVPNGVAPSEDLPISLHLTKAGEVVMQQDNNREVIEGASDQREMKALASRLELMKLAAAPHDLIVILDVHNEVVAQRFVDVLNCMASQEVTQLTLTDHD